MDGDLGYSDLITVVCQLKRCFMKISINGRYICELQLLFVNTENILERFVHFAVHFVSLLLFCQLLLLIQLINFFLQNTSVEITSIHLVTAVSAIDFDNCQNTQAYLQYPTIIASFSTSQAIELQRKPKLW